LERFLLGDMSPRQAAPMMAHLLGGCERCRQEIAPLASAMFATGPLAPEASSSSGAEYDFPLFKAFAAARRYAATIGKAKEDAKRLSDPFPKEVPAAEAHGSQEWTQDPKERCEFLLEQCRSLRYSDPEGMVLTATLAVTLAEQIEAGLPEKLADLRARAWAELGNARRVADDLPSAEGALSRALALSGQGTGDPLLLARLMDLTASLYIDQRRFEEANRLLDWVYVIYRTAGDVHSAGRALISKGVSANYSLESEQAIGFLSQGLRLIDPAREPKLVLSAVHGITWCLVDCGRVSEASALLDQTRSLYTMHGERFDELRAHWLEGRIAAGLKRDARAEEAFLHVQEGFRKADLPYDRAIVSLDLAALWLHQGRTAETIEVIDEMVAIFRARNIRRETIGALLMLREAVQKDQATTALLQAVAGEFRRLERFPARKDGFSA
jgi:tetratricopeptide (TPR) repeat protein